MRFLRYGESGTERPAAMHGGEVFAVDSITTDIDSAFLSGGGIRAVRTALESGSLPRIDLTGTRIGPPFTRPGAILCIGTNYAAHAVESGVSPPEVPVLFLKTPNTIGGPNDVVQIPPGSVKTDWEVELGVVIGQRALYLDSPEHSMDHVAGFVAADDVSERDFQLEQSGGQWSKGKCAPGFTPLGPWLVTPDEFDHRSARLRSWVNGEPRQDSLTSDMIFDVSHIVWHLSQYLALEPGDLILTGTPEGVALSGRFPYLSDGDTVEIEIEGLGRLAHQFHAIEQGGR